METNELKNIWKTLADEKLVGKELAEENIERIIALKSSNTIAKFNKKLKINYIGNGIAVVFILVLTISVSIYNYLHGHIMPLDAYAFLFFAMALFIFKSINYHSKIILNSLSSTSTTIMDSLNIAKRTIEKIYKREMVINYTIGFAIIIFGNVLLNKNSDFENFNVNSLQGYVMIISLIAIILSPFTEKRIFKMRFSGVINDIKNSLTELEEN